MNQEVKGKHEIIRDVFCKAKQTFCLGMVHLLPINISFFKQLLISANLLGVNKVYTVVKPSIQICFTVK